MRGTQINKLPDQAISPMYIAICTAMAMMRCYDSAKKSNVRESVGGSGGEEEGGRGEKHTVQGLPDISSRTKQMHF